MLGFGHTIPKLRQNYKEPPRTFYVRPAGSTYGTGDGTSYENAWSGFTNVVWSEVENTILAVCGTHLQDQLNIQANNVTIIGNDPNEEGVLDGENVTGENLLVVGYTGIEINNLTSTRATTSCFAFKAGSSGETNNCTTTFSGNQGLQHLIDAEWTHNNLISTNNTDDGVSLHEAAIVTLNDPTLTNNSQGVAHIGTSQVTINGGTFSSNSSSDLKCGDIATSRPTMTVNNLSVATVDVRVGAIFTANNCTITDFQMNSTGVSDCDATLNDCIVDIGFIGQNITKLEVNDSLIDTGIIVPSGIFEFNRSYVLNCEFVNIFAYTLKARHSLFVSRESTNDMIRSSPTGKTLDLLYCSFVARFTSRNQIIATDTSIDTYTNLSNLTFYDTNNNSRALLVVGNITIENWILTNFDQAILTFTGGTVTANNCVFFDNTLDEKGAGTLTKVADQSGDPNFADVATYDFSLGSGSSALGTGKTLTDNVGILSADWGNGTTETPTVTTGNQPSTWNIGAFVNS